MNDHVDVQPSEASPAPVDETYVTAEGESTDSPSGPPRWRTLLARAAWTLLALVLGLAALALVLYNFGSMERPSPEMRTAYEQLVAAGQAPPVQAAFSIPIPGCKCHSDDPVVTMQHKDRHIRECSGCHG